MNPDIPLPASVTRDADGRMVAVRFASGNAQPADGPNAWLVAVDGSEHALRAVAEAIRLADRMKECTLHLVNVQHWLSKEAAETELAARGWTACAKARARLEQTARPWQLHVAMGEAAERIVALAGQLGCQGIVIGSRGLGTAENLLVGSVAYKVIHISPIPVLVVR